MALLLKTVRNRANVLCHQPYMRIIGAALPQCDEHTFIGQKVYVCGGGASNIIHDITLLDLYAL